MPPTEFSSQEKLWLRGNVPGKTWPWGINQVIHKVMKIPCWRDASHSEHSIAGEDKGRWQRPAPPMRLTPWAPIPTAHRPQKSLSVESQSARSIVLWQILWFTCASKWNKWDYRTVELWSLLGTSWWASGWPGGVRTSFVLAQEQLNWPEFLSLFITAAWKCISWFVFFLTNFCDDKSNMFSLLKKLDPMCIGSSHCTS